MAEKEIFAIYSRKSRFTGKGESIENQIEMCRQYIAIHDGAEAAEKALVFEDEGFSGKNLERPQFKRMMAEARAKKFKAIVVYRLDRISRNIGDFAKLIEELNAQGIDFISIKENFDTASPMGRAMMYISSVFSQLERETIAERIRDNLHELAKTGRWLGGMTPTGYKSVQATKVTMDGRARKAFHLAVIPEEAQLVRLVFDKFLETNSLTMTETFFLQNGYTTKRGNPFTRFALRGILTNPVYMIADDRAYRYLVDHKVDLYAEPEDFDGVHGVIAYNRTDQEPGRRNHIKPMEEWIVAVGGHEGLISGADWVKVQKMLEENSSKSYRKPRTHVALLSGVLRCGNCGEFMRPKLTSRKNAKGELIYTYMCSMKERSRGHICNMKNCNGNLLDAAIIEQVKALSEDGSEFVRQMETAKKALAGDRESCDSDLEQLQAEIDEVEDAIKKVTATLPKVAGTAAERPILEQIEEYGKKREALRRRLSDLKELTESRGLDTYGFDFLAQMLSSFSSTVDGMTVEQKRYAIRTFVKQVIWDGTDVHMVLFGSEYPYNLSDKPSEKVISLSDDAGISVPSREDSK